MNDCPTWRNACCRQGCPLVKRGQSYGQTHEHACARERGAHLTPGSLPFTQDGLLGLGEGMLATYKAIIPRCKGASSCHTIYNAWARHRNAGPKQGHLIDSLGQSYSRTRGACTREWLYYMKECLLQTRMSSYQMRTIMWPDT